MPGNVIVTAIIFVLVLALLVTCVEFFVPLSVKVEMNTACRMTLLTMEKEGGINEQLKTELKQKLTGIGLQNVAVNGTTAARQGEEIVLNVQGDYKFKGMVTFLMREDETQPMAYAKTTVSRRVVN